MSYPTLMYENCISVLASTLLGSKWQKSTQPGLSITRMIGSWNKRVQGTLLQAWLGPGTQTTALQLLSPSLGSSLLCVSFHLSRWLFCSPRVQCSDWSVYRTFEDCSGFMKNPGFVTKIKGRKEMDNREKKKMTDLPIQLLFKVVLGFMILKI